MIKYPSIGEIEKCLIEENDGWDGIKTAESILAAYPHSVPGREKFLMARSIARLREENEKLKTALVRGENDENGNEYAVVCIMKERASALEAQLGIAREALEKIACRLEYEEIPIVKDVVAPAFYYQAAMKVEAANARNALAALDKAEGKL